MKKYHCALLVLLNILVIPVVCGRTINGIVGAFEYLPSGRQTQLIEDSKLASAAYADEEIPTGYRAATRAEYNKYINLTSQTNLTYNEKTGHFETVMGNHDNGLAGSLLINEKDGSIVLAFRGTEFDTDTWDKVTDGLQLAGFTPEQYSEAAEMLSNLIKNTKENAVPIKVVGHSLGGALAAYATLNNDASRVTATTFNAAGLTPPNDRGPATSIAAITNIRVENDIISGSRWEYQVGNTYNVKNAVSRQTGNRTLSNSHDIKMLTSYMILEASQKSKKHAEDWQTGQEEDKNSGDGMCRVPDENNPANGDLTSSSDSVGNDGGVCYPGENGSAGSGNDEGGMCFAPPDDYAAETDATQYPGSSQESWKEDKTGNGNLPGGGDIMNEFADQAALVGPNFPYRRILWLFSGESPWDSFKTSFSSLLSGASDDDRKYFSEIKDSLRTITGIGN